MKCTIEKAHDGSHVVKLGKGIVAFGIRDYADAADLATVCNALLEDDARLQSV